MLYENITTTIIHISVYTCISIEMNNYIFMILLIDFSLYSSLASSAGGLPRGILARMQLSLDASREEDDR